MRHRREEERNRKKENGLEGGGILVFPSDLFPPQSLSAPYKSGSNQYKRKEVPQSQKTLEASKNPNLAEKPPPRLSAGAPTTSGAQTTAAASVSSCQQLPCLRRQPPDASPFLRCLLQRPLAPANSASSPVRAPPLPAPGDQAPSDSFILAPPRPRRSPSARRRRLPASSSVAITATHPLPKRRFPCARRLLHIAILTTAIDTGSPLTLEDPLDVVFLPGATS